MWVAHAATAFMILGVITASLEITPQRFGPITGHPSNRLLAGFCAEAALFYALATGLRKEGWTIYPATVMACGAIWQLLLYVGVNAPEYHTLAFALLGFALLVAYRLALCWGGGVSVARTEPKLGVAALLNKGLEEHLPRVPGFHVKEFESGSSWAVSGRNGILIPIRDAASRIAALQIRADFVDGGPRYIFLSSKKRNGASPGSPAHVPLFDGDTARLRITEGVLKADIATTLSNTRTVGLPPALPACGIR